MSGNPKIIEIGKVLQDVQMWTYSRTQAGADNRTLNDCTRLLREYLKMELINDNIINAIESKKHNQ